MGRTFDLKGDAEVFLTAIKRRQQLGGVAPTDAGKQFLSEYVEEYWRLHAVPNLAAHTRLAYRGAWDRYIRPRLGGYRLREITPKVVGRFQADLKRVGAGDPTIVKTLTVLQSILGLAVTEGRIDSNPVAKVRKPSQRATRHRDPITPTLVEEIRADLTIRDATLISVLAYAGVRPGEALALEWGDVGRSTLAVEHSIALGKKKTTKTRKPRTVVLSTPWRKTSRHGASPAAGAPAWSSRARTARRGWIPSSKLAHARVEDRSARRTRRRQAV